MNTGFIIFLLFIHTFANQFSQKRAIINLDQKNKNQEDYLCENETHIKSFEVHSDILRITDLNCIKNIENKPVEDK
ncbi:MAG: hypothetical protein KDK36_21495 [Leptospiraceae bacterium]|nr:hypothetical protein [Leptospiraceae bacterium]